MQRLKNLRKEQGLTMKQLGKLVGVSESTVSLYENEKRQPDYTTLQKFADIFNVTTDYLLGRTDEPTNTSNDEELQGVDFALYGETKDLTEDEKQDILSYIRFKKSQRGEKN